MTPGSPILLDRSPRHAKRVRTPSTARADNAEYLAARSSARRHNDYDDDDLGVDAIESS